jgi:putative lipoprotein
MKCDKEISGNVNYLEKVALLPGSTLQVSLVDVTQSGMKTLATKDYSDLNQNFMDYTLNFDMEQLQYGHSYSISASILYQGEVVFTSTNHTALDLSEESLWVKDVTVKIVDVSPDA